MGDAIAKYIQCHVAPNRKSQHPTPTQPRLVIWFRHHPNPDSITYTCTSHYAILRRHACVRPPEGSKGSTSGLRPTHTNTHTRHAEISARATPLCSPAHVAAGGPMWRCQRRDLDSEAMRRGGYVSPADTATQCCAVVLIWLPGKSVSQRGQRENN